MEITFQYPPELFQLLVDVIPLLCRSKKSVLLFFEGAGVSGEYTADIAQKVKYDKESIYKIEIAQTILERINRQGEKTLRERREVLKRIVEYEDFSGCWPSDIYKAKGIIADIRRIVNVKDSFTKIKQELEKQTLKSQSEHLAQVIEIQQKQSQMKSVKDELFSLFALPEQENQKRGKLLEATLNHLFKLDGILIKEAFEIVKDVGTGITEQIDGVIEIDGHIYLVEMKWWKNPLGKIDVSPHLVNIFNRGHAGGIIISNSSFTKAAIETCKEALTQKTIVLCELEEIVMLLEQQKSLKEFFKTKIQVAITERNPLFFPNKAG